MFGADKKAHTDAFIKAVVAKVGPKKMKGDITKESQPWRRRQALGRRGKEGKLPWQELHHRAASPSGYQVLIDKNTLLH